MTYAPATLTTLGKYWTSKGGRNLGVVGDPAHQAKGTSYHLGADQLTATAYSRQTARDRRGLTNGASAIDLGKLNGSYGQLRSFSSWLVAQARKNAPGTIDIREIIYSPDGKRVLRWDRERGYASVPWMGEADDSHLWHTHVSWYRDAEKRDHTTAFRPYFAPKPPAFTWRIHIAGGAIVRAYILGPTGNPRCIASWNDTPWPDDSSAPASAPVGRTTCSGDSSATTTLVTAGKAFKGKHIRVGHGVTLVKEPT
jgi:hypothetical protein